MRFKMLIGAPVSHYHLYCTGAYLKSLQSLTYNNYDICLVDNSPTDKFYNLLKEKRINVIRKDMKDKTIREKIIDCRNVLREKVLDEGYDYFFSVEQDILLPKNAVELLLKENKKIITGIYMFLEENNGKRLLAPLLSRDWKQEEIDYILRNKEEIKKRLPSWYKSIAEENFNFKNLLHPYSIKEIKESDKLLKVKSGGLGCALIHKDILEKIKFRYEKDKEGFDDAFFYKDALELGIQPYAHPKVLCHHMVEQRPWTLKLDKDNVYRIYKRK
ncbi:hypothetical protein J4414_03075 [Candidatus Woesearchaeota archaeon]|nr:hypothetical protein [Candidatus Woesearchaeota archaeon]